MAGNLKMRFLLLGFVFFTFAGAIAGWAVGPLQKLQLRVIVEERQEGSHIFLDSYTFYVTNLKIFLLKILYYHPDLLLLLINLIIFNKIKIFSINIEFNFLLLKK